MALVRSSVRAFRPMGARLYHENVRGLLETHAPLDSDPLVSVYCYDLPTFVCFSC